MSMLEVRGISVRYGFGPTALKAVDDVSLDVAAGSVLGLVGESGSGKSTVARAIMGLVPTVAGTVAVAGKAVHGSSRKARLARARDVQLIFQDPYSSLDPRMTISEILSEGLRVRGRLKGRQEQDRVVELLERVNLDASYRTRLARQLSGGQRQRVAIARALAAQPKLIIADEITSALDVSVQALILNLLRETRQREQLSMLFISHNLATVRYLSDDIAVMRHGRLVERAPAEQLIDAPQEEYTRALLAAVPDLRTGPRPQ